MCTHFHFPPWQSRWVFWSLLCAKQVSWGLYYLTLPRRINAIQLGHIKYTTRALPARNHYYYYDCFHDNIFNHWSVEIKFNKSCQRAWALYCSLIVWFTFCSPYLRHNSGLSNKYHWFAIAEMKPTHTYRGSMGIGCLINKHAGKDACVVPGTRVPSRNLFPICMCDVLLIKNRDLPACTNGQKGSFAGGTYLCHFNWELSLFRQPW